MSKELIPIDENLSIDMGDDHALGFYLQIIDIRYMNSGLDVQGEGFIFCYDDLYQVTFNLIRLKVEDMLNFEVIKELADIYIKSLEN